MLKIGTRSSPLAMMQTEILVDALLEENPDLEYKIVQIQTSGDWTPEYGENPLPEDQGGKAQFAKEIEQAILEGTIDCGVHSVKDMATELPEGLIMEHFLPREDARDALLSTENYTFDTLPKGSVVGTCSPRRSAILKHKRPDIRIVPLRGNVHTRIRKLCARQVDATILAMAGLKRLGLDKGVEHGGLEVIDTKDMLPACGQGAIGIEIRDDRDDLKIMLEAINCPVTAFCVKAERQIVHYLDGSCHTPIAVYVTKKNDVVSVEAMEAAPDGSDIVYEAWSGALKDHDIDEILCDIANKIGQKFKRDIKAQVS